MKKKNVLVIGGAGYIGSHMVRLLIEAGHQPIVYDNLSTGHRDLVPSQIPFVHADLCDQAALAEVFESGAVDAVVHFAAASLVPESVENPLKYYRNNVAAFITLLNEMIRAGVKHLIFSSTAAVFGEASETPLTEDSRKAPKNPYGHSKLMMEQIVQDAAKVSPISYVILRYFNAAGAHDSGELGERHDPETHLIPNMLKVFTGRKDKLTVFGNDYETRDGTCVRDYVHVQDLCDAHLSALQYLDGGGSSDVFNLGSETGSSILEVIAAAEKITNKTVRVDQGGRREGDPATLIASSGKARKILKWEPKRNLETIVETAWRWQQREDS